MMKSGIGESITKAQKEVGDCGTGAETPKDTRSGRTKCTRSHVTSQPKLQDMILVFSRLTPSHPISSTFEMLEISTTATTTRPMAMRILGCKHHLFNAYMEPE